MQLPTEEAEAYTNVADSFTDGEHVTYRRTRERTHGGLRERPLTPDLLHHPSLTYDTCSTSFSSSCLISQTEYTCNYCHDIYEYNNICPFTCQVRTFEYIFGSVLVFHTIFTVWYFWPLLVQVKVDYWRRVYLRFFFQLPHMPRGSHPCLLSLQSVVDLTRHPTPRYHLQSCARLSNFNSTKFNTHQIVLHYELISTVAQGKPTL